MTWVIMEWKWKHWTIRRIKENYFGLWSSAGGNISFVNQFKSLRETFAYVKEQEKTHHE